MFIKNQLCVQYQSLKLQQGPEESNFLSSGILHSVYTGTQTGGKVVTYPGCGHFQQKILQVQYELNSKEAECLHLFRLLQHNSTHQVGCE